MRRANLLLPIGVLAVLWLATRGVDGEVGGLEGPGAMDSAEVGKGVELELDVREVRAGPRRVAVSVDEVPVPSKASVSGAVRLRLARHSSQQGTAPPLGRVLAWTTGSDRRGVEVVVTGVNADGWTEVALPALPGGADRLHAVWDEPGWTSSVATTTAGGRELYYLQLTPRRGACLAGKLVDARGEAERNGEVALRPRGAGGRVASREQASDGEFRLRFTEAGTYDLFARGGGGRARRVLELDPARPPADLVVFLEGAGRLRGRLLDVRGNGVADWPLLAATEGELFDRLRLPTLRPRVEEDDDVAPGRAWAVATTAADGTFEWTGLRVGVFAVATKSGPLAPAGDDVLATGLVPPVDGLELRLPVAWTTIEVTDERGRHLRFDPHERPGQRLRPGAPETDVYVVLEQMGSTSPTPLTPRAWRNAGTRAAPRWRAFLEAGVDARASVWAPDRALVVAEIPATPVPPETWTLRAARVTETAWLRILPVGVSAAERDALGFTVFDVERGTAVDRDVFRGVDSVEVGLPAGCYEVRIHPATRPGYAPLPESWRGEVTLAAGEERTLDAAVVRRGRLELIWHGPAERPRELMRRLSATGALAVQLTPATGVRTEPRSVTVRLDRRTSLDLAPGRWTVTATSEDGRVASEVVEIEAGETTAHELEVPPPR